MVIKRIRSLFNPENYQGWNRKRNYFEGWYFKILDREGNHAFAVIPGVAMDSSGERHSFIQILDGREKTSVYHKFDIKNFAASDRRFLISVGNNHFSEDSLSLDLPGLKGKLSFSGNVPWPKRWYSPGIMGPYTFAPFMQCYHGIVSMDHEISGRLIYNGEFIDFNGGRGYIEKDWGSSFPEGYIWLQSNHFEKPGISIKASVAKIPWMGSSFTGFISGVLLGDRLHRFTTYNGSVLKKVDVSESIIDIVIERKNQTLEIFVERDQATALASPLNGHMTGRIEESMSSVVRVRLSGVDGNGEYFAGRGVNSAVEVAGNLKAIIL